MKKQAAKHLVRKKGSTITMWALIVLIIFCLMTVFYVMFNKSYEVVDFPDFRKMVKKEDVQEATKESKETSLSHYSQVTCYEGVYLRNSYLITSLYVDFYKGNGLADNLSILENMELKDEYLTQAVQYLRKLEGSSDKPITSEEIKKSYVSLRQAILKIYDQDKFEDSPLLSSLFNAITINKKGQYALDAGGVEELLEKSQILLNENNIEAAYNMVLSLKEPYNQVTGEWLKNVGLFLRTQEVVNDTRRYVYSERYSKKFMRLCGQDNV